MVKKLQILSSLLMFSSILFAQQDSVHIEKAVLLFYDSTELEPVVNLVPYAETGTTAYLLEYRNVGNQDLLNYKEQYDVYHVSDTSGQSHTGLGLVHVLGFNRDSLLVGEIKKVKIQNCTFVAPTLGTFRIDYMIRDSSNMLLDSTSFFFEVGDTIIAKSNNRLPTGITGPSLFQDSNLNQIGGFMTGDRFGTLFEISKSAIVSGLLYIPTSASFYIANDTSNVGAEIVPKIWRASIDTNNSKIVVKQEVASAFIPFTISASNLGRILTLPLDKGPASLHGLAEGKYIVGFESTLPNPNGKSLVVGRDSLGEQLQPMETSFVYFGHDTNWYSINELPIINLNLGHSWNGRYVRPCLGVGVEDHRNLELNIIVYPNPSIGIFTVENLEANQMHQVYNINGSLLKASIINGQLDLSNEPNGIYLLRIQGKQGNWVSKKLMKL